MTLTELEALPLEAQIALAYCTASRREPLQLALALDQRLGQLVARTSEPMLGQMRLAWWREALLQSPAQRPQGDAVLDGISQRWQGQTEPLVALVNGWEHLLGDEPLGKAAALACGNARAGALLAALDIAPGGRAYEATCAAALVWALADLAAKVSRPDERALLIAAGQEVAAPLARLPAQARALAVLGALGRRSLQRGGRDLMDGRTAALTVLRAAIFLQ
ncbi:MAG: hypothetical protein ACXIUO_14390 [Erythrobacter sp.]